MISALLEIWQNHQVMAAFAFIGMGVTAFGLVGIVLFTLSILLAKEMPEPEEAHRFTKAIGTEEAPKVNGKWMPEAPSLRRRPHA